jgi:hypothetical protein
VKKLQFFCLIFLTFNPGCKKNIEPIDNSIIGKWTYTEYNIGIGGPGQWLPATPAGQTIEFKSDGTFISSGSLRWEATKFEILDSVTIKFRPASTPPGYLLMVYSIDTIARELLMYPVNPMCIEGCEYKYRR